MKLLVITVFSLLFLSGGLAQQCGRQGGGKRCAGGLCCSEHGYCGTTRPYCGPGCQSQCRGGAENGGDISSIIPRATFDQMLKQRNESLEFFEFFTYDAFIAAAKAFPNFGNTGDVATRKREIAAFFGQTSHHSTGSFNLLNNADHGATDRVASFKTAISFWMTPQASKPSCHDVITGKWSPSDVDSAAGRVPGYGMLTNIINGGLECGQGKKPQSEDGIGFYKQYCDLLGVEYGNNLECHNQKPF